MSQYLLNLTKQHRQSFIELVNNDNAGTVGTPLTLADVLLRSERALAGAELASVNRTHALTLENAAYPADFVEVFFNKIGLGDVMAMTEADGDFGWYSPDTWDPATSPAEAVNAFKTAATRAGIDPTAAMENIVASRRHDAGENRYYVIFNVTSLVFHGTVEFPMPKHFSDVVTVTELNGFEYTPLAAGDVVA